MTESAVSFERAVHVCQTEPSHRISFMALIFVIQSKRKLDAIIFTLLALRSWATNI